MKMDAITVHINRKCILGNIAVVDPIRFNLLRFKLTFELFVIFEKSIVECWVVVRFPLCAFSMLSF